MKDDRTRTRIKGTIPSLAIPLVAILLTGCTLSVSSQKADGVAAINRELLDVFPPSTVEVPADARGKTELSSEYTRSGSLWNKYLDEEKVFNFEIKHEQAEENSFRLRLGKGGQLYSLRGAFGESIPPQGVGNPWNDEVWQFVAVCSKYNHPLGKLPAEAADRLRRSGYAEGYFIHNSGAYGNKAFSGQITISFDVMLDPEQPGRLNLYMRGNSGEFGQLMVADGKIRLNGTEVALVRPGTWQHVVLAFEAGDVAQPRIQVTVRSQDGKETTATVPSVTPSVKDMGMLGFSADGDGAGVMYLDNVTVTRVKDGKSETPILLDFESDPQLMYQEQALLGADREKGAFGAVTDKVAATGHHSYEIRDAAGLEHAWQPMFRLFPRTTWGNGFYCPLLASDVPADGRTYRSLNWGLIPQQRTIHRSPILYYVQTRDLGDGIIEITYVVHNFSVRDDIVFDHLNAPWGGTRMSSLPYSYLSSPEGALYDREWMKEHAGAIGVSKTGGWNLTSAGESPDSPSLALVYGLDKHLEREREKAKQGLPHLQLQESIYRHMIGQTMPENWRTMPENAWRNYEVAVVIPKFRFVPDSTIWYRSYLVVNRRDRAIELAKSLVDEVDYGLLTFDPATTPKVPVFIRNGKVVDDGDAPAFSLLAKPVSGTMPLFLIENATTGQEVVTTDPYIFVPQEKLDLGISPDDPELDYFSNTVGYSMDKNNSHWKRLLGYGYVEKQAEGTCEQLSKLLDIAHFPETSAHHIDLWVERGTR
jgi:hypothetical protein